MNINIDQVGTQRVPADLHAMNDLLYIYKNPKMFMNEKGYLQKLVELLYKLGYYEDNKSIFGV